MVKDKRKWRERKCVCVCERVVCELWLLFSDGRSYPPSPRYRGVSRDLSSASKVLSEFSFSGHFHHLTAGKIGAAKPQRPS